MSPCSKIYFLTTSNPRFEGMENVIACYTEEPEVDKEILKLINSYPNIPVIHKRELDLNDPNKNSLSFYDFEHYYGPTEMYPLQSIEVPVKDFRDDDDPRLVYLVCENVMDDIDVLVACPRLSHAVEIVKRYGEFPVAKPVTRYGGELFIKCFYLNQVSKTFKSVDGSDDDVFYFEQ